MSAAALIVFSALVWVSAEGARILVISPYRGHSHSVGPLKIAEELWKRGHQLTVASFYPKSGDLQNYTSISLQAKDVELREFFGVPSEELSVFENIVDFYWERDLYLPVIRNEKFRALKNEKFDLVIVEYFQTEIFSGLIKAIGAPFILIHTTLPYPWQDELFAEPHCESYIPHLLSTNAGPGMSFFERMRNFVELNLILVSYNYIYVRTDQQIAEKYFGPLPNVRHINREASLFFINTHHTMTVPKPVNPSTIEIGGIHIGPPNPLPEDLKQLLDNSRGAIFFSFGSVMKGSTLPDHKKDAIMETFRNLNQTILWKWEDTFQDRPANVYTSKWFPQRDILAHPKMSLYIGHCGVLGLQEAVYEGIPTICLPFFADQHVNARYLEASGMGLYLNFPSLDQHTFREAVEEVLRNASYKDNARRISNAFRDRPMSPMDTAMYWTEYVLRHNGAHHLKSPARRMTWIEYHNVDVLATLFLVAGMTIYVSCISFKLFLSCLCSVTKMKKD